MQLLTALAKKSMGGTYSSVPDGTNLSAPFAKLLGGLLTVVAQDVRLTLTPKPAEGDLDTMAVAPGTDYTQTTDAATGTITIKFGTLFAGEARKVAVNFTLKASSDDEKYNATLADARHSYAAQETPQQPQRIQRVRTPTPSSPADAGAEELAVQAEEVRRRHADKISEASEMAEEAWKTKDDEKLASAREKLVDAQNALEDIMVEDGERMVDALRAELMQLLAYMDTHQVYDELGRPYALATVTSDGRQRTAGRGDEEEVPSLYVTPRMVKYLEQAKKFEESPEEPVPSAEEDTKEDLKDDPIGAIAAPLAFYLDSAIQALQAIQKIVAAAART
ncbi:unnamed protein product [Urochloa humidicola]